MRGEQVREQEDAWFPLPALGVWSYPAGLALLAQGVLPLLGCSRMCSSQRDGDGCKVGDEPGEHTAAARPHIPVPPGRVPWEIWGTPVSAGWMESR